MAISSSARSRLRGHLGKSIGMHDFLADAPAPVMLAGVAKGWRVGRPASPASSSTPARRSTRPALAACGASPPASSSPSSSRCWVAPAELAHDVALERAHELLERRDLRRIASPCSVSPPCAIARYTAMSDTVGTMSACCSRGRRRSRSASAERGTCASRRARARSPCRRTLPRTRRRS